jgi:hypothetical protein
MRRAPTASENEGHDHSDAEQEARASRKSEEKTDQKRDGADRDGDERDGSD